MTAACAKAGLPGLRFHDLQRQGLRAAAPAWWSPPRNFPLLAQVMLALGVLVFLGISVQNLPPVVNGAAYLVGAGRSDTFTAVSHERACGKCALETIWVFRRTGQRVSWPEVIPLGTSIPVRVPVWTPFGAKGARRVRLSACWSSGSPAAPWRTA
jgi:hypothetical protein